MPASGVIASLTAILKTGAPSDQSEALLGLLSVDDDDVLGNILHEYHHLGDASREQLTGYADRFLRVLPGLIRFGGEQTRFNCVEFLSRAGATRYSALLALCASDANSEIAGQAIAVLNSAARGFLARRGADASDDSSDAIVRCRMASDVCGDEADNLEMRALLDALGKALQSVQDHGRGDVLDMLVRMGKQGDAMLIAELRNALSASRNAILQDISGHPRAATFIILLSMLGSGCASVRQTALECMKSCDNGEQRRMLVETLKALGAEETSLLVRKLRSIPWLPLVRADLGELGPEVLTAWLNELETLNIDIGRKLEMLRDFASCKLEPVVIRVFEILVSHYSPLVRPVLLELTQHEDEAVRFHAVAALSRASFDGKLALLRGQLSSDSVRIRNLAAGAIVQDQFEVFTANFETLPHERRLDAANVLRRIDPSLFDKVNRLLESPRINDRLTALRVTSYIGVDRTLERSLILAAADGDRRVRACASAPLSRLATPDAARSILAQLQDADTRVKANAVEAVEFMGQSAFGRALVPLIGTDAAVRVRVNAAKALYTLGSTRIEQVLCAFAQSRDGNMRIAAVWALANIMRLDTMHLANDAAIKEEDTMLRKRMMIIIETARQEMHRRLFGSVADAAA